LNKPRSVFIGESMKNFLAGLAILIVSACGSAAPGPVGAPLSVPQLKFKVLDTVGPPVYCDPDFYPVARLGGEEASASANYSQIRAQTDVNAAIVVHEHLPSGDLTDAQKLTVYRAYKLLRALTINQNGNDFAFEYRVHSKSDSSIELVKGSVRIDGVVTVTSTTPSGPPNCPICLAASTMIATPGGLVRVTDIKPRMLVWTSTPDGRRVTVPVLEVGSIEVPAGHLMVHLKLADGRELWASPGHRAADGRQLGTLAVGDPLDHSAISVWELVPYAGDRTYDLLPAGSTATYWANGVLLSSTLAPSASAT
jgi:hypothetical protein